MTQNSLLSMIGAKPTLISQEVVENNHFNHTRTCNFDSCFYLVQAYKDEESGNQMSKIILRCRR